jgi:hypothetical protein
MSQEQIEDQLAAICEPSSLSGDSPWYPWYPVLCSDGDGQSSEELLESSPNVGPDGRVRLGDLFLVTEEQVDKAFLGDNNQYVGRTAWLGDALLHSDLSVVLYKSHPAGTKGSLSKMRQTLEANATMKVFLLEGTDAAHHIPSHLGTHAIGSAFECLYCVADQAGQPL